MAGPVPTYITTQTAAQTAFTVPFGLLAFVNAAIAAAVARGEFNVTVDCSLFVTEDVSNLRIYLDSLGYKVDFAKNTNDKSLNIDWSRFLTETMISGTVTALQGTTPWIVSGTVTANQGTPGALPWPVTGIVTIPLATTAVVTAISVTTSPTVLLPANPLRKGLCVQNTTGIVYVTFDTTSSTILHSYALPRLGILEKDNYVGPVTAVVASGSVTVYVTELV